MIYIMMILKKFIYQKNIRKLVVIVDLADNIIGFSFVKDEGRDWSSPKDKIKNYLECKNLLDIYGSLYWSKTLDANIEKREIYGQLDNYKFTFDIITRDIKSIQNLETGEFVKLIIEKYYILKKHCLFHRSISVCIEKEITKKISYY